MITPESGLRAAAAIWTEMIAGLRAFAIPMPIRFRGITVREGALIEGPAGWGEFSPVRGVRADGESPRWLASAIEAADAGLAGAGPGPRSR